MLEEFTNLIVGLFLGEMPGELAQASAVVGGELSSVAKEDADNNKEEKSSGEAESKFSD